MRTEFISLVIMIIMPGLFLAQSWAESAEDWFSKGKQAYAAKDYKEAVHHYSKALEVDPKLSKSYFNRGLTLFRLEKWSDARADFRFVCTADPSDHEAFGWIGLTYMKEEKNSEALAEFQKAINIEKRPVYFLNSASALFNDRQYPATIQFCYAALRLSPDPETKRKIEELIHRVEIKIGYREAERKRLEKEEAERRMSEQSEVPSGAGSDRKWNECMEKCSEVIAKRHWRLPTEVLTNFVSQCADDCVKKGMEPEFWNRQ
jgi:tetratricopeptide (TPR) repeat protein